MYRRVDAAYCRRIDAHIFYRNVFFIDTNARFVERRGNEKHTVVRLRNSDVVIRRGVASVERKIALPIGRHQRPLNTGDYIRKSTDEKQVYRDKGKNKFASPGKS